MNDAIDICVTLKDDTSYHLEVTTAEFMEKEKLLSPHCHLFVILSELTDNILKATIQKFVDEDEDAYWLKLYHMIPSLDSNNVNEILDWKRKEEDELYEKL